ncbi:MAG: cyclic nucleotide-binding domain-containing protein [Planctomycetota bacterium]
MRAGLDFLSDLSDADVEWLVENGQETQVIANTAILEEGRAVDALVFVLQGLVDVRLKAIQDRSVATLGPGELLGEMAFLEDSPASATITAVENSLLLKVGFDVLRAEAEKRPEFAARLYRAFAVTAARRLRERERHYGERLGVDLHQEGLSEAASHLGQVLEGFKKLLQEADQAALKAGGEIPEGFKEQIRGGFRIFIEALHTTLGDESPLDQAHKDHLGSMVQREVLPYLLLTRTAERLYAKPRGYAGDFLTIDWMYDDQPGGTGRLGPFLDRCFMDEKAAEAVRNRRGLLCQAIRRHLDAHPDRTVHVTTMACGPAREVFDAFEQLDDKSRMQVNLLDIDSEAIAQVKGDVTKRGLDDQVQLFLANLVYLALGRTSIDVKDQDLVYSIGLIDYFNDDLVGKLMNYAHSILRPGGELILGNFHPKNPDKAFMDHVVDWRLIHRSEDDMNRLFASSAFGKPCTRIELEKAGVNLFAACTKD